MRSCSVSTFRSILRTVPIGDRTTIPADSRVADGSTCQVQLSGEAIKEEFREMVVSMEHGVGAILGVVRDRDLTERTLELSLHRCGARHL